MEKYRLKRELITDFMKDRMPTLCEVEQPIEWWLINRIVPNTDDLEPCESQKPTSEPDKALGLLEVSHCYSKAFIEWAAYNYIRLHEVWVHKFVSQTDKANWITTEDLHEFWLTSNKG